MGAPGLHRAERLLRRVRNRRLSWQPAQAGGIAGGLEFDTRVMLMVKSSISCPPSAYQGSKREPIPVIQKSFPREKLSGCWVTVDVVSLLKKVK